jgi:hypothetical protein
MDCQTQKSQSCAKIARMFASYIGMLMSLHTDLPHHADVGSNRSPVACQINADQILQAGMLFAKRTLQMTGRLLACNLCDSSDCSP